MALKSFRTHTTIKSLGHSTAKRTIETLASHSIASEAHPNLMRKGDAKPDESRPLSVLQAHRSDKFAHPLYHVRRAELLDNIDDFETARKLNYATVANALAENPQQHVVTAWILDHIISDIPAPKGDPEGPLQMLVSSIDYNEYVGRIGVGKVDNGTIAVGQELIKLNANNPNTHEKVKITKLYEFNGLNRVPVSESSAGNIIALSGIGDITIGDTICLPSNPEPLPFVQISAPTVEMTFSVNDSPFAGREGKFVTSRQIRERLFRETLKDVSLRVSEVENSTDSFNVAGRGEMSLSILIETMRREGYEFQVSPPRVLYQTIEGKKCEPIERVVVDVPQENVGAVIEKLGGRKGELLEMTPVGSRMKVEFLVPSRGLFGYRNEFMTDTKGEGIMASVFEKYEPYKGDIARRNTGSLVAWETGESITYGLFAAQERGALFIGAGVPVYGGMVIGECPKAEDITLNVCKKKQLTNTRAAGSDEALRLIPPRQMSLEQCLEYLADDELLEVTPESLRIRKRILDHSQRMKAVMRARQG